MHSEAMAWIAQHATTLPVSVLDLGGRNINGTPRPLFPNATTYTVLDLRSGGNVDIVADAATWNPPRQWDVVVCAEVCEHTPVWAEILRTAGRALRPGGRLIVTTAAAGRLPHSGIDGEQLQPGEWYANLDPADLERVLKEAGFVEVEIDVQPDPPDVRAVATKPPGLA